MPRRRMIDPLLWDDHYIGTLGRDERLFLIGCIGNSDDEGRLKGHAAYLKAAIFMYDDDLNTAQAQEIKQACLDKMAAWPKTHPLLLVPYQNSNEDYLFFPNWPDTQKPSHPAKSKLPTPPPETLPIFSTKPQETVQSPSSESPSQSRSGQSSLGKVSIGKVSGVQEDFTKFLNSEKDLTDFLTTTLEKYAERGPMWKVEVIKSFWQQVAGKPLTGEDNRRLFELVISVATKYPSKVLARTCVKAARYTEGKHSPTAYFKTILEESVGKQGHEKSP